MFLPFGRAHSAEGLPACSCALTAAVLLGWQQPVALITSGCVPFRSRWCYGREPVTAMRNFSFYKQVTRHYCLPVAPPLPTCLG